MQKKCDIDSEMIIYKVPPQSAVVNVNYTVRNWQRKLDITALHICFMLK